MSDNEATLHLRIDQLDALIEKQEQEINELATILSQKDDLIDCLQAEIEHLSGPPE